MQSDAVDDTLSCACVTQHEHVALPMALFFVMVGAAVALQVFAPLTSAKQPTMRIGGLLLVVAGLGKCLAGYAPFWWRGKQSVLGVGMIPRGEVGLIFAPMGLTTGVFDTGLFSAVTLMVMVTTRVAPPLFQHSALQDATHFHISTPAGAALLTDSSDIDPSKFVRWYTSPRCLCLQLVCSPFNSNGSFHTADQTLDDDYYSSAV